MTALSDEERYKLLKNRGIIGTINHDDEEGLKCLLQNNTYGYDDLAKALRVAAQKGYESCARVLLEHNAMPDVHDTNGYSALIVACRQGHSDIVKLLIEFKCNINKATLRVRATGLHWAASHGHVECVRLLLKAGCNIEVKSIHGRTPLMLASRSGFEDCVEELLLKGACVNGKDIHCSTALHYASEEGNLESARMLILAGADVNAKSSNDNTPLLAAAKGGHSSVARLLLGQPKINLYVSAQQMTVLHWAAESGNIECIQLFLSHSMDIDKETENGNYGHDYIVNKGMTPLMVASRNGHCEVVKYLLNNGADVNKCDVEGYTPLTHAIHKDNPECVLTLIRSGAAINALAPTDNFHCPLFIAIRKSVECLKILLRANVNMNMVGADSRGILLSPLELALSVSNRGLVCRMLLSAGYRPTVIANPRYLQECLAMVAKDDEDLFLHLSESIEKCASLLQLCRDKVRTVLGKNALSYVDQLPLPQRLIDYVGLKELNYL